MTSYQADLVKLRELLIQAEHGGMTDELLSEIEERASNLFTLRSLFNIDRVTSDVVRVIRVLAAAARTWRFSGISRALNAWRPMFPKQIEVRTPKKPERRGRKPDRRQAKRRTDDKRKARLRK